MTQLVYTLGLITLLLTGLPFWLVSARRHAIISSFWSQEFWPGSTYLKTLGKSLENICLPLPLFSFSCGKL